MRRARGAATYGAFGVAGVGAVLGALSFPVFGRPIVYAVGLLRARRHAEAFESDRAAAVASITAALDAASN